MRNLLNNPEINMQEFMTELLDEFLWNNLGENPQKNLINKSAKNTDGMPREIFRGITEKK